ncbi:serine acetyltransferase [Elizabethkingia meningoseptica]|uniref:Serine acetyltransferase n=1 Tax=Elizabethkingia meningoseptica TaxID=238 RepID=A0A1T3IYN0_ELIME|nr:MULTISPECIES: serine O-acetyltransferase EpsC [Elizabethkingia]AQX12478.1 serine acetyltransferase [Elizabethkingia meningoseptica]MBG0514018.1 serine acetyltransferase [Elizabethkingia meningoseptica]MCL1675630.1 serine O-acetyltransferase [Elizabethkingia meningoseptica]MCL1686954.1 serine O-acetyltransferase [Elizabethkingia meningoseptica]MDE5432933.1 serine O-acetyltransferase [Elizabethkingia meningoseptica]
MKKVSDSFIEQIFNNKKKASYGFFDKNKAETFVEELYQVLFIPQHKDTEEILKNSFEKLQNILFELINNTTDDKSLAERQVEVLFHALPEIYDKLILDAESILEFDPATESLEEILLAYPGFFATYIYRISHQLWAQSVKMLPRILSEYGHSKTGIDIHPGAIIGEHFFIDHGTGIVIGETSVIGNNVKIYQGVTLGALNVSKDKANQKRHPNIEDNVIIYSGATILGGDTVIGRDSIIGGNVWITQNVPSNSLVYNKSEIRIKDNNPLPESLTFVI